jgi:hypothetical protein
MFSLMGCVGLLCTVNISLKHALNIYVNVVCALLLFILVLFQFTSHIDNKQSDDKIVVTAVNFR